MTICLTVVILLFAGGLLAGCSAAATQPTAAEEEPVETTVVEKVVTQEVQAITTEAPAAAETPAPAPAEPSATQPPLPTATPPVAEPQVTSERASPLTPTPLVKGRVVELEWPATLRLGDSDTVRLALLPTRDGYAITIEYPEHDTVTDTLRIDRMPGYVLSAAAQLDGVGFALSPAGEQSRLLPAGEAVVWRWTIAAKAPGQQRLSVTLLLRWTLEGAAEPARESTAFSRTLDVQVRSFFGLTSGQAMTSGFVGLVVGGGLGLAALAIPRAAARAALRSVAPNPALAIEPKPGLLLNAEESALLRAIFRAYQRVTLESEFLSGYSGARAFLARPIRPDGRADADTIIKIGDAASIAGEYQNYETFVKDTLPPVTARIQHAPVIVRAGLVHRRVLSVIQSRPAPTDRAALQYTFIGEPGRQPLSLRQALLENPDPALLEKLYATFAPNWWMQRRPYTFRLGLEYDRLLPSHLVLEPAGRDGHARAGLERLIEAAMNPSRPAPALGDYLTLRGFTRAELRPDGRSLSLTGSAAPGQPPIRVRWLGTSFSNGDSGRVVANRFSLLTGFVAGFERFGFPDPLERLPVLLQESVSGTRSVIHGDLNLENVLLGPGGLVWLIDFAQTREGHTLFDFAHLEAELIAHVLAPRYSAEAYARLLGAESADFPYALRFTLQGLAARCLFDPARPREYDLALYLACLGALKYTNLDPHARHLLYLTAAATGKKLK